MKSQIQENICKLYLRLNGYFTNSLIIHSPGESKGNRTDIDLLGIRFPNHKQTDRGFDYDEKLEIDCKCIELIIGEVKGQEEDLKFNKSIRQKYPDEIIKKLFNWVGMFSDIKLESVIEDYRNLIQTKEVYNAEDRFDKTYSINGGTVRLRPIIFGVDRDNLKPNQLWHITGKMMIDFFWRCFKEEIECRDCQLKYDYKLWGAEFEPIIRYFKELDVKPDKFNQLYEVLAPTKAIPNRVLVVN